jgi:hypothetical protein
MTNTNETQKTDSHAPLSGVVVRYSIFIIALVALLVSSEIAFEEYISGSLCFLIGWFGHMISKYI